MIPFAILTVLAAAVCTRDALSGRIHQAWVWAGLAALFAVSGSIVTLWGAGALIAVGFYTGCVVILGFCAVIALWPILEDTVVEPRRFRRWQRQEGRRTP